jgi:hypothetical protein
MAERTQAAQYVMDEEIGQALKRACLEHYHPIRELLSESAEIMGVREAVVRVRDDSGQHVTLDERIRQLRIDPRFTALFPQPAPKVAKDDLAMLRANFERIADGSVVVE